ncbi:MAG: hypothetical protein ABIK62_03855, partial [candidate division WOR-3 bacterium]
VSFVDTLYGWMSEGRYPAHDTFIGGQGFIVRTRDGGSNWVPLARDTLYDYFDIDFVDSLTGWVVGGDDRTMTGYVAHTTDGGKTWIGQGLPEAGMLRALDFVDARHGWAVGMFGTVLRSSDGGATWQDQASGVDSTLFDVDFADTLHGVASGTGSVIVTSDGGQTWTKSVVGGVEEASSVVTRPARLELLLSGSVAKGKVCFHCRSAGCNGSLGDALRLMVYDAKGCMVKTLTIDRTGSALWDGRDWAGRPAPSGAYFARLDKGDRLLAVRFLYLAD